MIAIMNGSMNVVKLLIEFGTEINKKDKEGNASLHIAAISGHSNIFMYLVAKNANLKSRNN